MTRRGVAWCAVLLLAVPCFAGNDCDFNFNALVKMIEAQYGVQRARIPFLGLAMFCLRVGRVPGAADFKIAVFENLPQSNVASNEAFERSVQRVIGSGWHPLMRARSSKDGSVTMIYANPDDKNMRVLIVALNGTDGTIVRARVKKSQVWKWLSKPQDAVNDQIDSPAHPQIASAAN